jgi:hypothetical protein
MVDLEEQIVILYAVHRCGGKGRKGQVIRFIIRNDLMKARPGDTDHRQTGETKLENDLAFAREDLKEQGWLSMPEHGVWQITQTGREKLLRVAKALYDMKPDQIRDPLYERLNAKLLGELRELGQKAADAKAT